MDELTILTTDPCYATGWGSLQDVQFFFFFSKFSFSEEHFAGMLKMVTTKYILEHLILISTYWCVPRNTFWLSYPSLQQFANELIDLVKHAEDNSASNKEVKYLQDMRSCIVLFLVSYDYRRQWSA
jgi:hypothetical protein